MDTNEKLEPLYDGLGLCFSAIVVQKQITGLIKL